MEERLRDLPRPGAPDKISAEQCCRLFAMACESPAEYGLPITHWTHRELAEQLIGQGIVETISASQVGRLLKKRPAAAS